MATIPLAESPFHLHETLHSGQVFHWVRHGSGYLGAIDQSPAYVEQDGQTLRFSGVSQARLTSYLALDHPWREIVASFPKEDSWLSDAISFTPGLRILRQPRWECLATFLTSSLKQVAHISQISLTLRRRFGQRLTLLGQELHAYPSPIVLVQAGERALRECGLGYRAKFLWQTAKAVAEGEVGLEAIAALSDAEAQTALRRLPGVGPKIAHCVLLFAYERMASFPIDVWVERVLRAVYVPPGQRESWPSREMPAWGGQHFGPYAGYAQQFLFHYARRNPGALPR